LRQTVLGGLLWRSCHVCASINLLFSLRLNHTFLSHTDQGRRFSLTRKKWRPIFIFVFLAHKAKIARAEIVAKFHAAPWANACFQWVMLPAAVNKSQRLAFTIPRKQKGARIMRTIIAALLAVGTLVGAVGSSAAQPYSTNGSPDTGSAKKFYDQTDRQEGGGGL
jgi:hypothetical protein